MQETERAVRTALPAAQNMANNPRGSRDRLFLGAEPRSYGLDATLELEGQSYPSRTSRRFWPNLRCPEYGEGREVCTRSAVNFALDKPVGAGPIARNKLGNTLSSDNAYG